MEHTNLLYYATQNELAADYPNGKVDRPIPGVAYAKDQKTVYYNKKKVSYAVTVNYEDRSGNTLAESAVIYTPETVEGKTTKVIIYPVEVEDAKPISQTQKITVTADTAYTYLYYVLTSYTVTVNHMFSGVAIACATTIEVEDIYEEDVVSVAIEPVNVAGYIAHPVIISVSGDCEYDLEYEEDALCYVDLGLPSGTLWACNNIGASSPEEDGYYFAWGETEPTDYVPDTESRGASSSSYKNCADYKFGCSPCSKYNSSDGKYILEATDDAANVHMGGEWHIPTIEQVYELLDNTTRVPVSGGGGVKGAGGNGYVVFTSNINGNELIIPIPETLSDTILWLNRVDEIGMPYAYAWAFEYGCEGHYGPATDRNRTYLLPVRGVLGEGPQPGPTEHGPIEWNS